MEFKGTKGKWVIKGDFTCMEVVAKDYGHSSICALARQSSFDSNVDSEQQANAKLISCAPEMLETLQSIIKEHDLDIVKGIDSLKIRELIKKATEL